jgi:hypothetical protein
VLFVLARDWAAEEHSPDAAQASLPSGPLEQRLLGGDEVAGFGALELLVKRANDPDVRVARPLASARLADLEVGIYRARALGFAAFGQLARRWKWTS